MGRAMQRRPEGSTMVDLEPMRKSKIPNTRMSESSTRSAGVRECGSAGGKGILIPTRMRTCPLQCAIARMKWGMGSRTWFVDSG
jgi:hypothetical protein